MTCDNFPVLLHACEQELTAIYNVPAIVFYIAIEADGEFRFASVSRDFLTATGLIESRLSAASFVTSFPRHRARWY